MSDRDAGKRRLGRGLDAILPAATPQPTAPRRDGFMAPIEDVYPNRDQPRTRFDEAALAELAASIRQLGVLEPILVRKRAPTGFEIIAGERRWRAAQKAGLREVPVFVRELSHEEAFEAALVENLQREDLNPIEIARAFQRLIEEHSHTQESVATRVGKDRSTVANALRLLRLPPPVLDLVESGQLTEGHGRAILGAGQPEAMVQIARLAIDKRMSVRETERRARAVAEPTKTKSAEAKTTAEAKSANVRDLEQRLARALDATVTVLDKRGEGQLEIKYTSYEHLDRILDKLL